MDWSLSSNLPSISEWPLPSWVAIAGAHPDGTERAGEQGRLGIDRPLRAVIIEDELFAAWFVEGLLESLGHEVLEIYATGEDAITADLKDADLIIVDINLGKGIDGIETASILRRSYEVPIVFCSAYSDNVTRQRISETLPTAGFLNKPVSESDLLSAIQSATRAKN